MDYQDFEVYYYEPIESEYSNEGNSYANDDNETVLEILFLLD